MNHSLFRFEYKGEIKSGIQPEDLALSLSKLFTCSIEEVTPLTSGLAYFIREDLNEFTAQSYLRHFNNIGAIGRVIEQTAINNKEEKKEVAQNNEISVQGVTAPSNPHCPKCLSEHVSENHCLDCGIFFAKYLQHQKSITQQSAQCKKDKSLTEQGFSSTNTPQDEENKKAAKWLSIASLMITIIFITDGYLQEIHFFSHAGFDIGYTPFYIAHLALIWGCVLFARSKGYTSFMGFLGGLSLIGLSILLLLPNRKTPNTKVGSKVIVAVLSCWIISGVWVQDFINKDSLLNSTKLEASALSDNRHVYPSLITDSDNRLYEQEYDELMSFLVRTLGSLNNHSFRPDDVSSMTDWSLNELAKYEIWLNHQRYLHVKLGVEIPDAITHNNLKKQRLKSFNVLQEHFSPDSPSRMKSGFDDWLVGINPEANSSAAFWSRLNQFLFSIYDQIRNQKMRHRMSSAMKAESEINNWHLDLSTLKLGTLKNVNIATTKNTITLSAVNGPLSQTPLTLIVYMKPYKKRFDKVGHILKIEQISPGFPNKYLSGNLNVLNGYHADELY